MKSLILSALFAITFNAQARSLQPVDTLPVTTAMLSSFQISHDHIVADGGHITVDLLENVITLELYNSEDCGLSETCLHHELPGLTFIELPLVSSYQDRCGSTIYVAKEDKRPVDGQLRILTATDHSTIQCKIGFSDLTQVQYTTVNPRGSESVTSFFGGAELGPLYEPHHQL